MIHSLNLCLFDCVYLPKNLCLHMIGWWRSSWTATHWLGPGVYIEYTNIWRYVSLSDQNWISKHFLEFYLWAVSSSFWKYLVVSALLSLWEPIVNVLFFSSNYFYQHTTETTLAEAYPQRLQSLLFIGRKLNVSCFRLHLLEDYLLSGLPWNELAVMPVYVLLYACDIYFVYTSS